MIGPEWNQEKMVIFIRWILVLSVFAGLFFFQSTFPNVIGNTGNLFKLGIAALIGTTVLSLMFMKFKLDQYHYICWIFDVIIITFLVKYTGGAYFALPKDVTGISVNFFIFLFPLLVLNNSAGKPWYSGIGSAIIVDIILAYLFTTTQSTMPPPWPIFGVLAVFNLAVGSLFLFAEQWIVVGDIDEAEKKKKQLDTAYENLRNEVKQREKREQELYDKTRKLTTVIQVSRLLGSSSYLSDLLDVIIEKAREEMNSQMSFIMLVKDRQLEVVRSIGVSEITKDVIKCKIAPGQGVFSDVIMQDKSFRLNLEENKEQFDVFAGSIEKFKTVLLVPLRAPKDDMPLGVLGTANLLVGSGYNEEHEDFLGIFAIEAAMFIKQLKLKQELEQSYFDLIRTLAQAIEAKDPYTRGHVNRVADYSIQLAKSLRLPVSEVTRIEKAAILHDVGKIATPEHILNKPGRLTDEEFTIMKEHVVESRKLLSEITGGIDDQIKNYVSYHHERWDGMGYPRGLKGDQIPLGAQIIAVADTFDAMTSDRPYRKGFSFEEALKRLIDSAGTQFDAKLLYKFFEIMDFDPKSGKIRPRIQETVQMERKISPR